jgi:RimJ/RimL family protein N-acetyltransferase
MPWEHLAELCLENERVQLRALQTADIPQLALIAYDESIWRYFVSAIGSDADLDQYVHTAVDDTRAGRRAVFAVIERESGRVAGSMAYGNLAPADLRLEIGWSWLGRAYQRTGLNRAAKLLLLDHAFDTLRCERVEFKTDVLNSAARQGLEGIGAQAEGVLRSFNVMPGGRRRDALYFSILRGEWPATRARHFAAYEALTA